MRSEGFSGAFIVLSGYSDFKYAQTALQFGASYYLTKPIDEDELEKAVQDVHEKIEFQLNSETSRNQYLKKAKTTVLYDLLTGNDFNPSIDYQELGLSYPIYQVLIYESYMPYFRPYSFILNELPISILSIPGAKECCIEFNSMSKSQESKYEQYNLSK